MAGTDIKRTYDVHPMNGENYFGWKYEMEHFLKSLKVCTVLLTPKPVATVTNAKVNEINAWDEEDCKAHVKLVLNILKPVHSITRSARTAAAAWKALSDHYDSKTLENDITIMRRIWGRHW